MSDPKNPPVTADLWAAMNAPSDGPAAQERAERTKRYMERYDALMAEGKHGHYETLAKVCHEAAGERATELIWEHLEETGRLRSRIRDLEAQLALTPNAQVKPRARRRRDRRLEPLVGHDR